MLGGIYRFKTGSSGSFLAPFNGELGLLVSSVVFVKNTASNCLVNLLNCRSVKNKSEDAGLSIFAICYRGLCVKVKTLTPSD